MAKLFIGMPVYNGADFISQALDSLIDQTFSDWTLLISDNASEDETENICRQYCSKDSRIRYQRQKQNIGAVANFKFLLDSANFKYFMWAAVDDVWHPEYLTTCINNLDYNEIYGAAFCNIVNIDARGKVIRTYPDFSIFASNNRFKNIYRYLFSPEILGKANLIYSVYRLDLCKAVWEASPLSNRWGSDMCFVLAVLARSNLTIDNQVLFQKRIVDIIHEINGKSETEIINPYNHIFELKHSAQYIADNLRAVKGTDFYLITLVIMICRVPNSFNNYLKDKFNKVKKKLAHILQ